MPLRLGLLLAALLLPQDEGSLCATAVFDVADYVNAHALLKNVPGVIQARGGIDDAAQIVTVRYDPMKVTLDSMIQTLDQRVLFRRLRAAPVVVCAWPEVVFTLAPEETVARRGRAGTLRLSARLSDGVEMRAPAKVTIRPPAGVRMERVEWTVEKAEEGAWTVGMPFTVADDAAPGEARWGVTLVMKAGMAGAKRVSERKTIFPAVAYIQE